MKFEIIKNKKIFFSFSTLLVILSIVSLSVWGLDLGIDFTGGSLLEITTTQEVDVSAWQVNSWLGEEIPELGGVRVQPTGNSFFLRMKELTEDEHQLVLKVLETKFNEQTGSESQDLSIREERFESIGPVIGQELKTKALWAIGLALVIIVLFVAIAFAKVSKPVASWKYGLGAIVALAHDVLIVLGIFSVLGHFLIGYEANILLVTALLTILGYSVNDTIVVYDRIRENLIYSPQKTFDETVNKSVNETIGRSINTSLTTLFVLLALYFLGGSSIKTFVLALIVGTISGAYSSIFVASPLLTVWHKTKK